MLAVCCRWLDAVAGCRLLNSLRPLLSLASCWVEHHHARCGSQPLARRTRSRTLQSAAFVVAVRVETCRSCEAGLQLAAFVVAFRWARAGSMSVRPVEKKRPRPATGSIPPWRQQPQQPQQPQQQQPQQPQQSVIGLVCVRGVCVLLYWVCAIVCDLGSV